MAKMAARRAPTLTVTDWMQPLPPANRWVLHGDATVRAHATPVWGVAFSETACRATLEGARATLWLGPDEYLLLNLAPFADGPQSASAMEQALERALADTPHALVDVSHRQFALQLTGPHASAILNGGCPLDLDLREFPVGMCTRTIFAKADIVLWRTGAEVFHLEAWRSFSGYITGVLGEIAREYYGPIK